MLRLRNMDDVEVLESCQKPLTTRRMMQEGGLWLYRSAATAKMELVVLVARNKATTRPLHGIIVKVISRGSIPPRTYEVGRKWNISNYELYEPYLDPITIQMRPE